MKLVTRVNSFRESNPRLAWRVVPLIRLMVGAVFVSEGIQKFLYPEFVGPGRFARMGFENPEFWATLVGAVEIGAGVLLLLGLFVRGAALALIVIMSVAIVVTKIPILLGQDLGPFQVRSLDYYGFWSMAHEMRTDWSMLLGSLFLLVAGSGPLALDQKVRGPHRGRSRFRREGNSWVRDSRP